MILFEQEDHDHDNRHDQDNHQGEGGDAVAKIVIDDEQRAGAEGSGVDLARTMREEMSRMPAAYVSMLTAGHDEEQASRWSCAAVLWEV